MTRIFALSLVSVTALWLAGCAPTEPKSTESKPAGETVSMNDPAEKQAKPGDPKQLAMAAKASLFERLSSRLLAAMSDGGPAAAIKVCSEEAPKMAEAVGAEHHLKIGRTSFKLRNPRNAPPEWAQPLIEQRSEENQFVELPSGGTGALLPIKLKVQCMTCHGPEDQIAEDVKAQLAKLYPDDQATGFQEGDLRGWFWVEVPAALTGADDTPKSTQATGTQVFAKFDEVYIPALALTNQEKAKPSAAAFKKLNQRWQQLQPELKQAIAADSRWPEELQQVDEAINAAAELVKQGQLKQAHERLEMIRDLMMEARRRQAISYPLDTLSDFHAAMEDIVKPATKLTPDKVDDKYIGQLKELCARADEKWKTVEAVEFNFAEFGIDAAEATRLSEFIQSEREAINTLQAALKGDDRAALLAAAKGLKPPFAKAYMFFGDFPEPAPQS